MIDPTLKNAVDALERLSEDPYAQDAAYLRSIEVADYEAELRRCYDKGVAKGIVNGIETGRRDALRDLCSAFGIPLSERRERALEAASLAELDELFRTVATHRAWPEQGEDGQRSRLRE